MKRFSLLLLSVVLLCTTALAQVSITGTVVQASDNEPIIGATVTVVGTKTGTATDLDGKFTISVPNSNSMLNITYIGMTPVTVKAENGMTVELNSNAQDLDEVVVVAYGTAKKSELTGAVSQVTSQQIEARPVTSVTSAPAPKIRSPRFSGFRSKRQLKPARKMKVQQMLCCQR